MKTKSFGWWKIALLSLAVWLALSAAVVAPAQGRFANCSNTVTVTSNADAGSLTGETLRQALLDVCGGGTINFDNTTMSGATISLTSGELVISKHVTIDGSGLAVQVTIDGGGSLRVFEITGPYLVMLKNLTIANGNADKGGGIYSNTGELTVENSTFTGNNAGQGGAIYNWEGYISIGNSTFSGNSSVGDGSVLYSFFGSDYYVEIENSSFYNNSAGNTGVIFVRTSLTVENSTFSNNHGGADIADFANCGAPACEILLANNIFANADPGNVHLAPGGGTYFDGGRNISDTAEAVLTNPESMVDTKPLVGALDYYGGSTKTIPLLPGSPAINAGDADICEGLVFGNLDQRGKGRLGTCDIGSFESQGFTLSYVSGSPQSATVNTAFADPLVVGVTSNATDPVEPVAGGQITFTAPSSNASATFAANPVTITSVPATCFVSCLGGVANADATANGITGGPYTVTASANGVTGTASFSLTNKLSIVVIGGGVVGQPGGQSIVDGGDYTVHFTSIDITFNTDAYNPAGDTDPDDVTNPLNYLLLQAGPDGDYDTTSCQAFANHDNLPLGDDVRIPTGPVTYTNHGGAGPFVATVTLNKGVPLPSGEYRGYVCGTTSITNLAGVPLNGGLDSVSDFRIYDLAAAPAAVPATGFAPNRVTALPSQTVSYADLGDLWLEIPALGVQMPIVGVPQSKNGSWDVTWLGGQAGWLNGSAFPSWAGNSVLTAHVYDANGKPGPFAGLNRLWYGSQVIVHAWGGQYVYAVRSVMQVAPGNTAAMMKHQELPWLTLVTCRGYDQASNSYKYRVLVRAVLVEVK